MSFLFYSAITISMALLFLTSPKAVVDCQYRAGQMYPGMGSSGSLSSMYNSRMLSLYPMAMMNPQFGSFGGMSGSSMMGGGRGGYLSPSSMFGGGYGQQMMGRYPQQMMGGMGGMGMMPGMMGGSGMMPGMMGGQYGQYGQQGMGGSQSGQYGGQYGGSSMGGSSGGSRGQSGSSSMQTTPRYGNNQY